MAESLAADVKAMSQVDAALSRLNDEERARVLDWAVSKYRGAGKPAGGSSGTSGFRADVVDETGGYEDLAGFHDAANPNGDQERALVGAYWLQVHEGADDVDAMTVNTRLKHLGHGIGNVTRAFEGLKALKPALIVQTRKEGKTQQARKKFKVTAEGKKRVLAMLKAGPAG